MKGIKRPPLIKGQVYKYCSRTNYGDENSNNYSLYILEGYSIVSDISSPGHLIKALDIKKNTTTHVTNGVRDEYIGDYYLFSGFYTSKNSFYSHFGSHLTERRLLDDVERVDFINMLKDKLDNMIVMNNSTIL